MAIADNVADVRARIEAAALRAGRDPLTVALMAVTKTFPPESIKQAYGAGIRIFGENRVQEFAGKVEALRDLTDADWHLIGHLQTNKSAKVVELFSAVDSLDSMKLANKLNGVAEAAGKTLPVLIEINIGGERAKAGVTSGSTELEEILFASPSWNHLAIRGLMTVPPYTENPADARPFFRRLREIRDQIAARSLPSVSMDALSMGMSHDFEVAIEEGSTCVRVGTAIFGQRGSTT